MSRYFVLPVIAVVLVLAGFRKTAGSAPREEVPAFVMTLPLQERSESAPEPPPPAPQFPREDPKPSTISAPTQPARQEPLVIVLEVPSAPAVRTEIVERTVAVPQPVIVNQSTTINSFPIAGAAEEPGQNVMESPVVVFVCPIHRRPGCCPPPGARHPAPPQDNFFKTIPFMTALPKGPRLNP